MTMDEDILELTKNLISLHTVSKNSGVNADALAFIEHYLKDSHLFFKKYHKNGIYNLVISNKPVTNNFDLILHGHIDVIPATNPEDFIPRVGNGKLFGRGSMDMKGGLAALIVLMREIGKGNIQIDKNIALFITADEELGGANGTKYLIQQLGYKSKFFLTGEGVKENFPIYNKSKGVLSLKVKSKGKGKHASLPWLGESAIDNLINFYHDIRILFPKKDNKNNWYSTCLLSTIYGGEAINSVSEYAEGSIDIRFTEEFKSADQVLEKIYSIQKNHPGISLEVVVKNEMLNTSRDNNYIKILANAVKKNINPWNNYFLSAHGVSDARFAAENGIPGVEFGPSGNNSHSTSEYVKIDSLSVFYDILKDFIKNI